MRGRRDERLAVERDDARHATQRVVVDVLEHGAGGVNRLVGRAQRAVLDMPRAGVSHSTFCAQVIGWSS